MDAQLAVTGAQDIEVIAETPQEMRESNQHLIQWCEQKIAAMRTDFIELDAAYKSALAKKWKSSVLKRHADKAKKRIAYYHKIQQALVAGFYIVPNFPVHVFAIRTAKEKPLQIATVTKSTYRPYHRKDQQTEPLEQGAGDYVSPFPDVETLKLSEAPDVHGQHEWETWAAHWQEVDFPLCMARPRIMEATDRAMELKIFDDLGVLSSAPQRRRGCGDPIIVARILDPRSNVYSKKMVSFIIAWSLDTRTI